MQKNVLIVDNDEYNAQKIGKYLTMLGMQVTVAKNGQFGLSALRSQKPDLIFLSDTVSDIDVAAFLERKKRILTEQDVPLILCIRGMKIADVKLLRKRGASDVIARPVALQKLKKMVHELLRIPLLSGGDVHLTTEVFIREGVIVAEIGGCLVKDEIAEFTYRVLDTAREDQTLKKRFYFIIYSLEDDPISQNLFDGLFEFVDHIPRLAQSNIKILTSDQRVIEAIRGSRVASGFEIVDNYIDGLNKLKALYLENQEGEVLVEFLKPNVALYKNVYDRKGNLVKEEGKSFTSTEIEELLRKGTKKLYYTRRAQVGEDRQILATEDLDVVMDSINVNGIVVPESLTEPGSTGESKKGITSQVLIINGNEERRTVLQKFFSKKGFTVAVCGGSREALGFAQKSRYDHVIIDLALDGGNGLNLLKSLKLNPNAKSSNFILTAEAVDRESVEQAVKLGVRGFLKSPFSSDKLEQLIAGTA